MWKKYKLFWLGLILGALSGAFVTLPNFTRLSSPSKYSEVKSNLGAVFTTQVSYFAETNTYASGSHCFELLDWSPDGGDRYAYYCGDDVIENKKGEHCPRPDIETISDDQGFTVMAVGNVDNDPACDVWIMNDGKILMNVVNDQAQ